MGVEGEGLGDRKGNSRSSRVSLYVDLTKRQLFRQRSAVRVQRICLMIREGRTVIYTPDHSLSPSISLETSVGLGSTISFPPGIDLLALLGIMRLDLLLGFVDWVLEDCGYTEPMGSGNWIVGRSADSRSGHRVRC